MTEESRPEQTNDKLATEGTRINPDDFPLTEQDRYELNTKRGLSDESIAAARLGSLRSQDDLTKLGVDWDLETLPSTLVIPYGPPDEDGLYGVRLHKRSLPGTQYPPYVMVRENADLVIVAESELKALAAYQLGFTAVGLQGIHSHLRRLPDLIEAIKTCNAKRVVVALDTVREIDAPITAWTREEPRVAHALAYAFDQAKLANTLIDLPEKYLREVYGDDEAKYRRADLDEVLAAGMTTSEFDTQVAAGHDFWASPAPLSVKTTGAWYVDRENILEKPDVIKKLIDGSSLAEAHGALRALAGRARGLAYDETKRQYDLPILNTLADKLKRLFKTSLPGLGIEDFRKMVYPPREQLASTVASINSLLDFDLVALADRVVVQHVRRDGTKYEMVANFAVEQIRSGQLRYLDGHAQPLHIATVRTAAGPCTLKLSSVFEPTEFVNASSSRLTIISPRHFRTYMTYRIDVDGIQTDDANLNGVLCVGTVLDGDGQLVVSDGVRFPQGTEECHYDQHRFADSGSKAVFKIVADLFKDQSVAFILAFGLGTFLKPALRWAYPHLGVEGDSGVGKTTIMAAIERLFGWKIFSGPLEFQTSYRGKKLLSNSVLPVQVEEVGRIVNRRLFTDLLNQAFNLTCSTHGHLDKRFNLVTPAMVWGQDIPIDDIALRGKFVRVDLDPANKDLETLKACRECRDVWPMREWADFICDWVNRQDVNQLVDQAQDTLEQQVGSVALTHISNVGRIARNYATISVAAQALKAFGVPVELDRFVTECLHRHLTDITGDEEGDDRSTIARQFLTDLVRHIQAFGSSRGLLFDVSEKGLFFHPESAMEAFGPRYDIKSPKRMRALITGEQLGRHSERHSINGVETRCTFIPHETLVDLGFDFSKSQQAEDDL